MRALAWTVLTGTCFWYIDWTPLTSQKALTEPADAQAQAPMTTVYQSIITGYGETT